jgi:hypothetical protein
MLTLSKTINIMLNVIHIYISLQKIQATSLHDPANKAMNLTHKMITLKHIGNIALKPGKMESL